MLLLITFDVEFHVVPVDVIDDKACTRPLDAHVLVATLMVSVATSGAASDTCVDVAVSEPTLRDCVACMRT